MVGRRRRARNEPYANECLVCCGIAFGVGKVKGKCIACAVDSSCCPGSYCSWGVLYADSVFISPSITTVRQHPMGRPSHASLNAAFHYTTDDTKIRESAICRELCSSQVYFARGPLTPAPITLGNSALPIAYSMLTPNPTRAIRLPVVRVKIQNGALISCFWQALPP